MQAFIPRPIHTEITLGLPRFMGLGCLCVAVQQETRTSNTGGFGPNTLLPLLCFLSLSLSLSVFLSLCFSVSHFFRLSHSLLLPICHFTLVVKEYSIYFSKFNNAPSSLLPGSRVICIFFRQGATSLNSISLGRLVVHFA